MTLYRLITHALAEFWRILRARLDPFASYRAEIVRLRRSLLAERRSTVYWRHEAERKAALIAKYDVERDIVTANRWHNLGVRAWERRHHKALVAWRVKP